MKPEHFESGLESRTETFMFLWHWGWFFKYSSYFLMVNALRLGSFRGRNKQFLLFQVIGFWTKYESSIKRKKKGDTLIYFHGFYSWLKIWICCVQHWFSSLNTDFTDNYYRQTSSSSSLLLLMILLLLWKGDIILALFYQSGVKWMHKLQEVDVWIIHQPTDSCQNHNIL